MGCRYAVVLRDKRGEEDKEGDEEDKVEVTCSLCATLTRKPTLTKGKIVDLLQADIADLYEALVANKWSLPKAFQPGGYGRRIWAQKQRRGGEEMLEDIVRVYAGITHPAVPQHMSDRAYKVATGTEFVGRKFLGDKGVCGRCGCMDETTAHRYGACAEVHKLWTLQ